MFTADSRLELTPEKVGPCRVLLEGIVGEGVELTTAVLEAVRPSEISYHLAKHLLYNQFRDPSEPPKMHLFGQIKRAAKRWLDEGYLVCTGGTTPAMVTYLELQFEVPYRDGMVHRRYWPDDIVRIDDGGAEPLNLIVEIKAFRNTDAQLKAETMRALWVPGANNLSRFGRWGVAEFTAVFEIEAAFGRLMDEVSGKARGTALPVRP